MDQVSVALCRPVNWDDINISREQLLEVVRSVRAADPTLKPDHDPLLGIYPDSVIRRCVICDVRCWVGPRLLGLVERGDAAVGCIRCVLWEQVSVEEVQMVSMNNPDSAVRPNAGDDMPLCAHCCRPMDGYAQINDDWLCHPDDETALDCYGLVSAGHPKPCVPCMYREKLRG